MHRTLAALSFALLASTANAQVIDQNAPAVNAQLADFFQGNLAQSFTQSANNVVGAGIFLDDVREDGAGSGTLTINLWSMLPNAIGATQLASGSAAYTTNNRWVDVFWSPVYGAPGQTYFLEFISTNTLDAVLGDVTNGYAGGQAYAGEGFNSFESFDYTFRTYAAGSVEVPEPTSATLLVAGMVGLGYMARRRRSN